MQDSYEPHIYWTRFTVKVHLSDTNGIFYFQDKKEGNNKIKLKKAEGMTCSYSLCEPNLYLSFLSRIL